MNWDQFMKNWKTNLSYILRRRLFFKVVRSLTSGPGGGVCWICCWDQWPQPKNWNYAISEFNLNSTSALTDMAARLHSLVLQLQCTRTRQVRTSREKWVLCESVCNVIEKQVCVVSCVCVCVCVCGFAWFLFCSDLLLRSVAICF
jgi:hypothetical protein